ncbi:RNA polymerase II C-terminal domain phosphatase-like 3 [Magnolia sinica]|uniref:RNA polymerase II C-terminal domain phosphatase-like 3 n=1 Tax=Magnolia sinica TaxID=86752 RepID=UPI0026587E1B|nr:RNA polymerase II C-terminal domain phosphatase-like 3 [Magnolia sinica]
MRIAGSNRCFLNPTEEKTLARMAKDGPAPLDIEEGEISEGSVEEISAEDFKQESTIVQEISEEDFKQESRVSKPRADSRAWYNYPSNYPQSGLYNLAWMSAVQNKPLNEILTRGFGPGEVRSMRSAPSNLVPNSEKEPLSVVIDVTGDDEDMGEKEEGELEEGEIDLESDVEVKKLEEGNPPHNSNISNNSEKELIEMEFLKRINSISEDLKTVTTKEAENSFHGACSQIRTILESLQLIISENHIPALDAVVGQTFTRIQAVHSVFHSASLKQQEQYKEDLSRLFVLIKKQDPALFLPEQIREIESMMQSLVLDSGPSGTVDKEKEIHTLNDGNLNGPGILSENSGDDGLTSSKKLPLEPISVISISGSNAKNGPDAMKPELPFSSRGRVDFGLLINPHVDYDEGSLPSPTRENPPPLPKQKPQGVVDVMTRSTTARQEETEDGALHPYVTDALKAVSSYQQKFGRTSFLSNRLPSPTPSEECDNDDGDSHGEVSSSSAVGNSRTASSSIPFQVPVSTSALMSGLSGQGLVPVKTVTQLGSSSAAGNARTVNPSIPVQPLVSTGAHINGSSGQGPVPGRTVAQLGPVSEPILKAPIKSRDPRLRYANSDASAFDLNRRPLFIENNAPRNELLGGVISSRKHKVVEESAPDGQTLKRQRNGLTESGVPRDVGMASGRGGRLEESSILGTQPSNKERLTDNMELDVRKSENGEVSNKQQHTNANFNGTNVGSQQLSVTSTGPAVSLPPLLKDINVNPAMLMHLIKMEKERLAAEARQKSTDLGQPAMQTSSSNLLPGSVSSGNATCLKPSEADQRHAGKPHNPSQTASMSEGGKVRMKPRDPRRILHNNMVHKNESLGSDQSKTNGPLPSNIQGREDNLTVREQGEHAVMSSLSSASLPDIAPQFTNKLKNIAAILSNSQMTNSSPSPIVSRVDAQPMPSKIDKVDVRVPMDPNHQQSATGLIEESSMASSQPSNPWGDVEHLFEGYDDHQRAALQKERARRIAEQNTMFAAGKLCLVLDLDHTLLNSAKFVEVDAVHEEILRKKEEQDREKQQRHLFRFPHMGMWTKLRPGIWNFLEKASKLYELHLYTMGNKFYATEMAKVLDPTGALFAGRVLSRGDDGDPFDGDERVPKSKDLDGVLGMESAVVIIDDSVRVWPHNKLNLIVVERYTYFPCSRRQFGLLGPSLLEIDHDERPEDGTLASSLAVIERIHSNFFSHRSLNEVDVRNILASEQRKILAGCRIVFSRVFPVGEANPHLHPLWQTAEQFGAVCTTQIDDQVTHVVANSLGTDKVNWALSTGRFVVHPGWVEASALLYRRANERDFAVKI